MNVFRNVIVILLAIAFADAGMFDGQVVAQQSNTLDWPQFRGPMGDGHANAENLPVQVGDEQNLVWKAELPGRGWSSPVIADGQAWMTTAIEIEATGEELEKKMANADIAGMSAYASVELKVVCLNLESGEIESTIDLFTIKDPPLIHSLNSFASPTAVMDEQRVYFHFGSFGTAAVDRKTKELVWQTQEFPLEHQTGPGSSPLLHDGLLILNCDGCDMQYVLALDTETGKQVWRTERSGKLHENPMFKKAFSTPMVVNRGGADQLISAGANWLYAYEPTTGEELWKLSYGKLGFSNVARPIMKDDMMYVCTCYGGSKLMAIDFSGGDPVTEANVKWTHEKQVPNMPSPIEVDNSIYFVNDKGIASCLDATTGEQLWRDRLDGEFSSSPLLADGKIYFANQDGELIVVKPNKEELEVLARNQLDSQIMASPAAIGDALYVRTSKSLYRFQTQNQE